MKYGIVLVVAGLVAGGGDLAGQPVSCYGVRLPEGGVTALSAEIRARAAYLESVGVFLQQAAAARETRAKAAEHELRNAAMWVSTYFDLRAMNRTARAAENPSHLQRVRRREEVVKETISKYFQEVLKGDVTDELNWLLRESASRLLMVSHGLSKQSLAGREASGVLPAGDVRHIRLTDAGRGRIGTVVFLADGSQVLPAQWPFVLRGPELQEACHEFERARDAFLRDGRRSAPESCATGQRLTAAVDRLCDEFNRLYPRERRLESGATYAAYCAGKHFLQSLALQVFRAVDSGDSDILSGNLSFQGSTVVELVDYMYRNGLEFTPPEPGDVRVYQRLFLALRAIYTCLIAQDEARPNGFQQ
jgi:hypothetical protein